MKKRTLLAVVATMLCVTVVGCGKNNNKSTDVDLQHGMTVVETGNQGTLAIESESTEPLEDEDIKVGESIAAKFGVQLKNNQGIVTAKEDEAIVITALDGYKFLSQFTENCVVIEKNDYSESFRIYDCTGTLTEEYMKEQFKVEDMGNGCFLQTDSTTRMFYFNDNVSVTVVYTNNTDKTTDIEMVTANFKALVENFKIVK